MVIIENFVRVIDDYAVFEGRANRSKYWWFVLATLILAFGVGLASIPLSVIPFVPQILISVFALAIITPFLAVTTRRLHDIGLSAWWLLLDIPAAIFNLNRLFVVLEDASIVGIITIIALICNVVMLVLMLLPSNKGENRYGLEP